jgi:solute carrier family 15 oligopeptide transporter 1
MSLATLLIGTDTFYFSFRWGVALGLFLLGIGTGGIKPCVAAYGGDQFNPTHVKQISLFFSMFYFSINAGSFISMIITPNVREKVTCFGQPHCYPLAFGIPAILMVAATLVFISGSYMYVNRPMGNNVLYTFFNVIYIACRTKITGKRSSLEYSEEAVEDTEESKSSVQDHWVYSASYKYSNTVLSDIKAVLSVIKIFFPVSFFWMLYDQQGSRWTQQAWLMNNQFFGTTIPPDAMQTFNAVFILILVALFEKVLLPSLARCGIILRPLKRVFIGLILTALAFFISVVLQYQIDLTSKSPNCKENCTEISILWQIPQYIILTCGEVLVSITCLEFGKFYD